MKCHHLQPELAPCHEQTLSRTRSFPGRRGLRAVPGLSAGSPCPWQVFLPAAVPNKLSKLQLKPCCFNQTCDCTAVQPRHDTSGSGSPRLLFDKQQRSKLQPRLRTPAVHASHALNRPPTGCAPVSSLLRELLRARVATSQIRSRDPHRCVILVKRCTGSRNLHCGLQHRQLSSTSSSGLVGREVRTGRSHGEPCLRSLCCLQLASAPHSACSA